MDYRHAAKRRTLALGAYPAVSLALARERRDKAREQLAKGMDPSTAKREDRQAQAHVAANTFQIVARQWLAITSKKRAAITRSCRRFTNSWTGRCETYAHASDTVVMGAPGAPIDASRPRPTALPLRKARLMETPDEPQNKPAASGFSFVWYWWGFLKSSYIRPYIVQARKNPATNLIAGFPLPMRV